MVDQGGNNFGDRAMYSCNENFVLDPAESVLRICMRNDWSGADPVCGKEENAAQGA